MGRLGRQVYISHSPVSLKLSPWIASTYFVTAGGGAGRASVALSAAKVSNVRTKTSAHRIFTLGDQLLLIDRRKSIIAA